MLTHIQIRDFAIIDAVELELGPGLTVLTGETGAGKSILVDALLLAPARPPAARAPRSCVTALNEPKCRQRSRSKRMPQPTPGSTSNPSSTKANACSGASSLLMAARARM